MKPNNVESNVFADEENLCSKNECLLQQNCHVSTMKTTIYIRLLPDPVCCSKTDTMGSKPSYSRVQKSIENLSVCSKMALGEVGVSLP